MARTALTVRTIPAAGESLTTQAADLVNGNSFPISDREILLSFFCASGGTVTIPVPMLVDGDLTVEDRVITLPAATVYLFIMENLSPYTQGDGSVYLTCSAATSVGVYKV